MARRVKDPEEMSPEEEIDFHRQMALDYLVRAEDAWRAGVSTMCASSANAHATLALLGELQLSREKVTS